MGLVNDPEQRPAHPLPRWRVLLVLGMLAGLLGMHALAPAGAGPAHGQAALTAREQALTMTAAAVVHDGCSDGDGCDTGHMHHADPTCASAAVGGGPVLPALVTDPVTVPDGAATARTYAITAPDGGRAPPPSLAELQLLRI